MEPLKEKPCLMYERFEKEFFFFLLSYLSFFLYMFYVWNLRYMMKHGVFMQMTYWVLSKTLPLMLFSMAEVKKISWGFKNLYGVTAITLITVLVFLRIQNQFSFQQTFGFKFHYLPAIKYLAFSVVYLELFSRKLHNHFKGFAYTLMVLSVAGLLYELPVFHKETIFYHVSYPLIVNSRWVMLPLICRKIGFKSFTHPLVLSAFTAWILFSLYYAFNPNQPTWLPRLPTLLFWLTPITVMRRKESVSV